VVGEGRLDTQTGEGKIIPDILIATDTAAMYRAGASIAHYSKPGAGAGTQD